MVTKTSCHFCTSRCGMLVHSEGNRVTKVEGDAEHPLSYGWTCRRGRAHTARRFAASIALSSLKAN
jgi:anaerobic selenocysteine-containing dehydrogenase